MRQVRKGPLRIAALLMLAVPAWAQIERAPANAPTEQGFEERQLTPSAEAGMSPGILCLPARRENKVPIVIMVDGSDDPGSDEDLKAQSMFGSIAHELARRGIASWRYETPSKHWQAITPGRSPLDVYITDGAVAALGYIARLPEVDPLRIYILGHGLGGTMAPYIAERYPRAAGIILMATPESAIEKTLAERKKTTLEKQGLSASEITEQVKVQNRIFADIRSGKTPPGRLVLGAPAAYWRDRMNRDPARKASVLAIPVLVLQGGKDSEAGEADYDRMQSVLGRKKNGKADFHWFPTLDHWFTRSDTTKSGEAGSNSVDEEAVRLVADWIKLHSAPSAGN